MSTAVAEVVHRGFLKVYLSRGFIGLPEIYRDYAIAIGLKKRGQTIYCRPTPRNIGNILKLKHLIKIEHVDQVPPPKVTSKGFFVQNTYLQNASQFKLRTK